MRFLVVGCSYRTAQLAVRERLAFSREELPTILDQLRSIEGVEEVILLSTCNRVEIWAVAVEVQQTERLLHGFLARNRNIEHDLLDPILYDYYDQEALLHIFRVTSSLDAMVVGETQIGGQVKEAYAAACSAETLGPLLNRCMHKAFATAKRIRTETHISRHAVSISSVAVELATRIFGDLSTRSVLVVGAGEMAELALQHLVASRVNRIRVTNRSIERAEELARQIGATAVSLEKLESQLLVADIVITSTGSSEPIINRKLVSAVMRQRKQRPIFFVDIAVPKDVEPKVAKLSNVYLFNLDDLEEVAKENLKARSREAREAEGLLKTEVFHFEDWIQKQRAVPVIKALRAHFISIARAEAERTAQSLHLENGKARQTLNTMADSIVNKLLHQPTIELKDHISKRHGTMLSQAAIHLFQLDQVIGNTQLSDWFDEPEEEKNE